MAGAPRSARDLAGGFSPGATTVLDCPGGAIFVKAVGAGLNPESPELHRREAVVSASLPAVPELPRLLDVYDDGDWVALAFVAVDGRPPRHPWEEHELRDAVRALDALHHALTPNPVAGAEPAADRLAHLLGGWAELAAMPGPPEGLDEWSGRHLDRLAGLEAGWPDALAGPTLLHCDVRSDNLLVASNGVVFVDWPHACVGAAVFDLVAWAPSVAAGGRARARRAPGHVRSVRASTATSWPSWSPPSAASWCATRCSRLHPASRRCVPSRPRRARWRWTGSGASPAGDARRASPSPR